MLIEGKSLSKNVFKKIYTSSREPNLKVFEVGAKGPYELSLLLTSPRESSKPDRQIIYNPSKSAATAGITATAEAAAQAEIFTREKLLKLETDTLTLINSERGPYRPQLKRVVPLDTAGFFGAYTYASDSNIPLGHAVTWDQLLAVNGLLATNAKVLADAGIKTPVTVQDLEAVGMRFDYVARTTTRVNLASIKWNFRYPQEAYAASGGVSEIAIRGTNLTPEGILEGFKASVPHYQAMMATDYIHAGCASYQDRETGQIAMFIPLGSGLNKNVNWPISTRGFLYTTYLPSVMRNAGS